MVCYLLAVAYMIRLYQLQDGLEWNRLLFLLCPWAMLSSRDVRSPGERAVLKGTLEKTS
jgi:hypothetical protein